MTKSDLIRRIATKNPQLNLYEVQKIVDMFFDEIMDSLIANKRIELRGLGAFSLRERESRRARNPRTNSEVILGRRFAPYFRVGKELKETLNS